MSQTVQKLNKLKNPESFIQVNTIKGYKYVDRAGEIVNFYYKNNSAPKFIMGLNGLSIEEPKEKIDELKITPQLIWVKFGEPDSLDMIASVFSKEAENILKILEINKINRIGWRNYFVYEFQNKEKQAEYLKKFTVLKNTKPVIIKLEIETLKDFNAILLLQPVIKNDVEKTHGILFDVDVFQNKEVDVSQIPNSLKKFREYLVSQEGFLSVINNSFK